MSSWGWASTQLARNDARFIHVAHTLTDEDWAQPSLCEHWSNKDVLAHLVIGCTASLTAVAMELPRHCSFDRANTAMAFSLSSKHSASELVAIYETVSKKRRGIGRLFPKNLLLGDHVIHELDILLALDRKPEIEDDVLKAVLRTETTIPNPFVPAKRTARGLNLMATDTDWRSRRYAHGPTASGPSWAIASVLANRPHALDELHGDGAAILAQRLTDNGHTNPLS
jgi:uncharacterized protein (TIGR03083 family)